MLMSDEPLVIDYFSDVLCIWAYGSEIRYQALRKTFAGKVKFRYRFISLFGDAHARIDEGWADKGGFSGFDEHLRQVCAEWPHVDISPSPWANNPPRSSIPAHLLIKAAQCCVDDAGNHDAQRRQLHELIWKIRSAFFSQGQNIAHQATLRKICTETDFEWPSLQRHLESGRAHAALYADELAKQKYQIVGSPELVFNEGRQKLYGNLGYRIIEANIHELLRHPAANDAPWC